VLGLWINTHYLCNMESSRENIRIQRWVLVVGIILLSIKSVAWFLTNSVAILTDALEGIINVLSAGMGLYALWLSSKPRDKNHPYGHGKVEFLSAGIEGTLIGVAGGLIIWESVQRLIEPMPVQSLDIGILLVSVAGIVNAILGWMAIKTGKRNHSLALESSGRHLMSDAWSTLGLIIGLGVLYLTGFLWLDALVAIIFGIIILLTGLRIVRRSVAGMMDEADMNLLENLVDYLNRVRRAQWVDIHNLRIIKFGSVIHIDCHLTLPWYFTVREAHMEVSELEDLVRIKYGKKVELFVHTDGCLPTACHLCEKLDCAERRVPFSHRVVWKLDNVLANERHEDTEKP
jgi:cation diffusion facilitator family transporter